jgi:hypothetical protein
MHLFNNFYINDLNKIKFIYENCPRKFKKKNLRLHMYNIFDISDKDCLITIKYDDIDHELVQLLNRYGKNGFKKLLDNNSSEIFYFTYIVYVYILNECVINKYNFLKNIYPIIKHNSNLQILFKYLKYKSLRKIISKGDMDYFNIFRLLSPELCNLDLFPKIKMTTDIFNKTFSNNVDHFTLEIVKRIRELKRPRNNLKQILII